jgi:hypothetical protein
MGRGFRNLDPKAVREGPKTVSEGREFHSLMVRGKKLYLR